MSKKKLKNQREKKERKTRREKQSEFKRPSKNQNTKASVFEGTVDHVNPRFAYIVTGIEGKKDIYVKTPDLHTALHGDRVEVEVFKSRGGENPEGRVKT